MSRILVVLSAADKWTRADGSLYDSGVWAEEFVVMHEMFVQAGQRVDVASPGGVAPTVDPHSMDPDVVGQEKVDHFKRYLASVDAVLAKPLRLADMDVADYDAVVIPGGHGPVEDLYKDADMGRILQDAQAAGKIIAPVCHGPAALLSAAGPDGEWLFKGRRMTAFTDTEERELGTQTTHRGSWPPGCRSGAPAMSTVRSGGRTWSRTATCSVVRIPPPPSRWPRPCSASWSEPCPRPPAPAKLASHRQCVVILSTMTRGMGA